MLRPPPLLLQHRPLAVLPAVPVQPSVQRVEEALPHVQLVVEPRDQQLHLAQPHDLVRLPVLVITGRYDMNVAPVIAWKIHKAIPGSRLVIFERSSHLPFLEEPERFKREVEDFLSAR